MHTIPPPSHAAFDMMACHLDGATRELFASYELVIAPSEVIETATKSELGGLAVIGYAGRGVRGALVLLAEDAAISAWMTAAGVPDGDAADTLGEFSNMLLGRLKTKLMAEGITIFATTPTTATGGQLRLSNPPGQWSWSAFDGPGWHLNVRLEASFDADFEADGCKEKPLAQEGNLIDFDAL